MTAVPALRAFAGYGIELEYMIVDRQSLSVMPVADSLLHAAAGALVSSVERGHFGWSNEIVLHLVEVKNASPDARLAPLAAGFQAEVNLINRLLEPLGARLMPTGAHPWMDPATETRLWPHEHAPIYQAYDRVFGCHSHGQANLQSMHLNLPFADDAEFARLHEAVRLVLPVLPALAASSPFVDGKPSGFLDARMAAYRTAVRRVPSAIGQLIPETIRTQAEYEAHVLAPLYRDVAPHDPEGVLQHEWLNARGAIPRFDRNAIEVRVIDVQECPAADLAIATAAIAAIRARYEALEAPAFAQTIGTEALASILLACIRDAERAVIDDPAYLRLMGFPQTRCQAGELWRHIVETGSISEDAALRAPLDLILAHGPLARRILKAAGPDPSAAQLHSVYGALCDCLQAGRLFAG